MAARFRLKRTTVVIVAVAVTVLAGPAAWAAAGGPPPPGLKLTPGFAATTFASGFTNGAPGASEIAFGANGDVFVMNRQSGSIFRFGRQGGVADAAHQLATGLNLPVGVAVSKDGNHLFAAERQNFDVVELSPVDGHRIRVVAGNIPCPSGLAADPKTGDLFFTTSGCAQQLTPDRLMRIADPLGRAAVSNFADVPSASTGIAFAPDGSIFMRGAGDGNGGVVKVDGPSSSTPGTVHPVLAAQFITGVTVGAGGRDGRAPVLVVKEGDRLIKVDLATTPPSTGDLFTGGTGIGGEALGPDACIWVTQETSVIRVTNADGSCPLALAAASRGTHERSSFSSSLVAITSISIKAKDLARSAGVGAVLLILVGFPALLFNNTLEENYDDLKRRFGPINRGAEAVARGLSRGPGWLGFGLFAAVAALLTGLLDPNFGLDKASVALFVGLLASFVFITLAFGWPERRFVHATHGDRGRLRVLPGTILVAAVCVLVSRLAGFAPGYLYGLLAGYAFAVELSERDQGRLTAWSSLLILATSLVAWIVWTPIGHMAAHPHPNVVVLVLDTVLSGLFVAGIEGLVFGLVPLRFLEGERLYGWNRWAWLLLYGLGMFAFVHVLLHPGVAYAQSPDKHLFVSALIAFAVFGAVSIAFWAWYRRQSRQPESASPEVFDRVDA